MTRQIVREDLDQQEQNEMEIYENFPINEFVDVIIHNSNDWGFHEESLYAVDLDTLKFKIRSQFPNTSHFVLEYKDQTIRVYL